MSCLPHKPCIKIPASKSDKGAYAGQDLSAENTPCSGNLRDSGGSAYSKGVIQGTKYLVNKLPGLAINESI